MRRAAGWVVFVAALVALGALIYVGAPPAPRWRVRLDPSDVRPADDGRLWVASAKRIDGQKWRGPFDVHAADSGERLRTLWPGETFDRFAVSPCGRWLVAQGGRELRWIDVRTGHEEHRPLTPGRTHYFRASPDGDLLALAERGPNDEGPTVRLFVLDLASGVQVAELTAGAADNVAWLRGGLLAYRDGEDVALWDGGRRAVVRRVAGGPFLVPPLGRTLAIDTGTGWDLWRADPDVRLAARLPANGPRALFAGTGPLVVLTCTGTDRVWDDEAGEVVWEQGAVPLEAFDRDSGGVLWVHPGNMTLTPDAPRLVVNHWGTLLLTDLRDGTTETVRKTPFFHTHPPRFAGGRLWFHIGGDYPDPEGWWERLVAGLRPERAHGTCGVLTALDWPSRRPAFTLHDADVEEFHVREDGRLALTVHDGGRLVQGWDVPARKPWAWAVGVPLALGAVLLALRRLAPRRSPDEPAGISTPRPRP